jgi:hypothetical protein
MMKKMFLFLLILVFCLGASLSALADEQETTSAWSPSYGGAYYQYVNSDGHQSDYNLLRWYNHNSYRVSVSYKILLNNGDTTGNMQYLEANGYQGYVITISHPFGARILTKSIVVQPY